MAGLTTTTTPGYLYGDNVSPGRASVAGGTPLTIAGLGLQANTAVQIGAAAPSVLASSATQLLVDSPAAPDGIYNLALQDSSFRRKFDHEQCSDRGRRPH